jgi:hypothetical protein
VDICYANKTLQNILTRTLVGDIFVLQRKLGKGEAE